MRRISVLLALAGVVVSALLLLRFDAAQIIGAALSVGWQGYVILLLWQGIMFALLGMAWASVVPGVSPFLMIWGRMVRDAATSCLPFSPVGGYVIAARSLSLYGVPWTTAAAGTVVDVSTEIAAQLLFSVFGMVVLLLARPGAALITPLAIVLAIAVSITLIMFLQRRRIGDLLHDVGDRLLGDWFQNQGGLDRLRSEMVRLYANPGRLAVSTLLHLLAWFANGVGTWIALYLLGHPTDLVGILALEALLDMVIGAAFFVPGAVGVQEAGLVGLGAVFGVPPDLALSASLLRRAKDIGWGLPLLGLWQVQEVRRL